jgi:hypothetical protein
MTARNLNAPQGTFPFQPAHIAVNIIYVIPDDIKSIVSSSE